MAMLDELPLSPDLAWAIREEELDHRLSRDGFGSGRLRSWTCAIPVCQRDFDRLATAIADMHHRLVEFALSIKNVNSRTIGVGFGRPV